jgi:hypothetical protein
MEKRIPQKIVSTEETTRLISPGAKAAFSSGKGTFSVNSAAAGCGQHRAHVLVTLGKGSVRDGIAEIVHEVKCVRYRWQILS